MGDEKMSNPKGRTIPDTLTMYLVIFVLYCLDIFFLQSDRSVLGDALYSRLAGLLVLFGYVWITKDSVSVLGISPKKKKLAAGAVYGTLFSVVPLFIVIVAEALYFGITDITAIDLQFSPPSMKFVRDIENLTPAAAVLIYIFTSFTGSLLKEFTFRGYILKKIKKVTNFRTANIIQALLYMFMTMPMLLRNSVMGYYDHATSSLIVFIVFFYIIHETIAGLKWGLLTRVTGSTYVAIVDHFLFVFLANSVYITNRYVTWSFMTHMLAVQIISFIFVLIYYKANIKKIKKKEEENKEEKAKKAADGKKEKEKEKKEIVDEKLKEINEISPDQYKAIVDETNASRRSHRHHRSAEYIKQRNEANSAENEALFGNVSASDAAKAASQYLSSNLNSSHHHSSHSHSHSHSHSSGRELESFDADEIAAKTGKYSDSLSLERKTPKHPHPHDTIARDSRLSAEELDKANAGKVAGFDETDIDEFLKNFSEDMSKPSRHHHHHHSSESVSEIETEDENEIFDADKFLENFQRKEERRHSSEYSSHSHSPHSSSHHHRHSSEHETDSEAASMTKVTTEKVFEEKKKTVEEKNEKKKHSVIQRVRELGKLDDSESNDLI